MVDVTGSGARRAPVRRGDVALAVLVGVAVVLTTVVSWSGSVQLHGVPPAGWALIVAGSGALAFRRRHPVPVAVVTVAVSSLYYPLIETDGALLVTVIIALYTVASEGYPVAAGAVSLLAIIGTGYGEFGFGASPLGEVGVFLVVSWLVAAVALGAVARNRRAYLDEAQKRARESERLRIARELHDVLGHTISLINVQAGAALHRMERDPAQAAEALTAIKESSRTALGEMRGTLGMLRQVDESAPTAPPPSLDRLRELTEPIEAAGLTVRVETSGQPAELSPAVDAAAFRIVQEALTNVTRHAQAGSVTIRIGYGGEDMTVQVADDGRGGPVDGTGHGIRGMAERARAVGGSLDAGAAPSGGFRVSARLPVGASS
ncbi:sensor histidine kinase [Haloactinopolyspora alba]|nr:sensor histidine kinase [Haloactinopolyspora alba]